MGPGTVCIANLYKYFTKHGINPLLSFHGSIGFNQDYGVLRSVRGTAAVLLFLFFVYCFFSNRGYSAIVLRSCLWRTACCCIRHLFLVASSLHIISTRRDILIFMPATPSIATLTTAAQCHIHAQDQLHSLYWPILARDDRLCHGGFGSVAALP